MEEQHVGTGTRQSRVGMGLAVLVMVALIAGCSAEAPAGESTAEVSRAQALLTLTPSAPDRAADAVPPPLGTPVAGDPGESDFRGTQEAADATAGIANVNSLVDSMEPLATFTPASRGPRIGGRVTYLRGGVLRSAEADGGGNEPLDLENNDMPSVWSPPDDPGRAWASADGRRIAMYVGPDAEMWTMRSDGEDNVRVSGANLPTDIHLATVGEREQSLRLRPGNDYTLVHLSAGEEPLAVLVDDNSRHIRGEARLRVVHAAELLAGKTLEARVNDVAVGKPMAFGQSSGDDRVYAGQVAVEIREAGGNQLAWLPTFTAGDRDLKTVFLYGSDELLALETSYEPGDPPSGNARARVFNGGPEPIDVILEDGTVLAEDLAAGMLSEYASVPSVLGLDELEDARIGLYGLRGGEEPVAWSPAGDRLAFLGVGDGRMDLFVSPPNGPAQRLTDDDAAEVNPVWSPDGRSLVWESVDDGFDLHDLRFSVGAGPVESVDIDALREALGWSETANVQFPGGYGWLDDRRVYFYPTSNLGAGGLWLADVQTGDLQQIFSEAVTEPDFSPEVRAWAFVPGQRPGEIVTLSSEGVEKTIAKGEAHYPLWSPDGRQVSYVEGDPAASDGWRLHVMAADGSSDRTLTDWWPLMQVEPPVPGPNAKRWWLDGGRRLAFTRAGRDYGAAERTGPFGAGQAGDDIENVWIVATDGSEPPAQATDLTQVFYLGRIAESPDKRAIGLIGFSYLDRVQQLWTLPAEGGKPIKIDGGVRWFAWER